MSDKPLTDIKKCRADNALLKRTVELCMAARQELLGRLEARDAEIDRLKAKCDRVQAVIDRVLLEPLHRSEPAESVNIGRLQMVDEIRMALSQGAKDE